MHIVRLIISGFRGVRSADITLGRHAVLVGPNNSGKTTIIEALALLFGRDRLVRRLTEHDFHGSAPNRVALDRTRLEQDDGRPDSCFAQRERFLHSGDRERVRGFERARDSDETVPIGIALMTAMTRDFGASRRITPRLYRSAPISIVALAIGVTAR